MCELCNLEKKTKWYCEDDTFVICDCESCKLPMIISKLHNTNMLILFPKVFEAWVNGLVKGIFKKKFHFRKEQRKVKDHWHWHIILEN